MVDGARRSAGCRVADTEGERDRSSGRKRRIAAHQCPQLAGLIGTDRDDDHAPGGDDIADDLEIEIGQAVDGQHEASGLERLVEDPHCESIADLAVGKAYIHGIAVVDDAEPLVRTGRQRVKHDRANDRDHRGVEDRARAHRFVDRALPLLPQLDIDVGVVGDESGWAADFGHHAVASVDAQPALDAAEVGAVADIDAGRADVDALVAVDAVAGRLAMRAQRGILLDRAARLAAIMAVGHVEGVLVGERRLNARPWAHVKADLLAHVAGERIGREGENADPGICDERRLEGRELLHQGRSIREIEHPGPTGPPRDHQPEDMLQAGARGPLDGPWAAVAQEVLATIALGPTFDRLEQVGPDGLRTEIAAPDPPGDCVHQEQRHRRQDEQSGKVIDLLRPDLDEEEIEAPVGEIDEYRLVGGARAAIPTDEREPVVDAERDPKHDPFDSAIGPLDALGVDLAARHIERPFIVGGLGGRWRRAGCRALRLLDKPQEGRLRHLHCGQGDCAVAAHIVHPTSRHRRTSARKPRAP